MRLPIGRTLYMQHEVANSLTLYCYSGYQVFLINSLYLALVMYPLFKLIQVLIEHAKTLISVNGRTAIQLFFIRTNNKRKHDKVNGIGQACHHQRSPS